MNNNKPILPTDSRATELNSRLAEKEESVDGFPAAEQKILKQETAQVQRPVNTGNRSYVQNDLSTRCNS